MSDHNAHFEATAGGLVLTNAILLYRTENPKGLTSYTSNMMPMAGRRSPPARR